MKIQIDMKDKEIAMVQDQLSQSYQEAQMEIDDKNARLIQLQTELELKASYQQSISTEHKQNQEMLNGHIDRLKQMLSQKSEVIDQLESQNK